MPISPNQGPQRGGASVTITGVNLANALAVNFGASIGMIISNTPTSITVITPPGNGVEQVTVTTAGGTSNSLNYFYIAFPIIISLSSTAGPVAGGNTININGYNLLTAINVLFGISTVVPTIISDAQISVVVPAGTGPGTVSLSVVTAGGLSASLNYTYYDDPTITNITPSSGSTAGGNSVTITGTNLSTTTNVTVGGTTAAFGVINSTTISIITPPGVAGTADVVVTTNAASATAVGGFTYVSSPGI